MPTICIPLSPCLYSLPFPADEDDEEGGDGDRKDPSHHGRGKGLSREQTDGLDMIKHVMLSLDEEDGLDQIYTFRWRTLIKHISRILLCLPFYKSL